MTLPRLAPASSYWTATRAPRYSLLFALPLLLLYEALAASLAGVPGVANVRNAADVVLKTPFLFVAGARGSLAFFAVVVAASVFFIARDLSRSGGRLRGRYFAMMLGESAVLGFLLGVVVSALTAKLLGSLALAQQSGGTSLEAMPVSARLMLALGAGLYEELLFRVLLVGGLAAGLRWLAGAGRPWLTGSIAATVGALIFSAFHYVGAYGDPWQLASFTYRAIAGLVFSVMYLVRGFGITAWTHALYDVYVMVL